MMTHKYDENAAKHVENRGFEVEPLTTPTYAQLESENRALRKERDEALTRAATLQAELLDLKATT